LADLRQYHQIKHPSLFLLGTITFCFAALLENQRIMLGRREQHSRQILLEWLTLHHPQIDPKISNVLIGDETRKMLGPKAYKFEECYEGNLDLSLMEFLWGGE
jgi:hypothetical protein